MIGIARNVGTREVVGVCSKEDAELLAPAAGLLGFNRNILTSDRRMVQQMEHLVAGKTAERKPQQQRDGLAHRALTARSAVDDVRWQLMEPVKRAFEMRQIVG